MTKASKGGHKALADEMLAGLQAFARDLKELPGEDIFPRANCDRRDGPRELVPGANGRSWPQIDGIRVQGAKPVDGRVPGIRSLIVMVDSGPVRTWRGG